MSDKALKSGGRVLVVGATGFIGSRLVRALVGRKVRLRLLVRDPAMVPKSISRRKNVEVVQGDLLRPEGLSKVPDGVHTTFYLVHSLGEKDSDYAAKDREAAENFLTAAEQSGLNRIIYLGGLGEAGEDLSEHLGSRAEIADILSSGRPAATVLRAAVIIGAGGASFEILRHLVERLPLIVCPDGIDTRIQPIAVDDVVAYLVGCLENEKTAGQSFDIGGPEIMTYRQMLERYAEARGLAERFIIDMPFLPARLTSPWIDLVTPVPPGISHPLLEGLKNEVVCRDDSIERFVSVEKTPFDIAVRKAFNEEADGPGVTGF